MSGAETILQFSLTRADIARDRLSPRVDELWSLLQGTRFQARLLAFISEPITAIHRFAWSEPQPLILVML